MITKLYLAGASSEIERARRMRSKLIDAGIHVMSTWVDTVDKAGATNPADASPDQLARWVLRDLKEVYDSNVLWLMLPALDKHTIGAWIELGYAVALGHCDREKHIVMSGPHRPIFTPVLNDRWFETDEEALAHIEECHEGHVQRSIVMFRRMTQ